MSPAAHTDAVAIVGMACRFADAADLRAFWQHTLEGRTAIAACPDPEAARYLDPESTAFERVRTLRGGYLGELWRFSAAAHGLGAAALSGANPEDFLALDLAVSALRNAGYEGDKPIPRERTAIVLGHAPYMDPATVAWVQHGLVLDQTLDLVRRLFPHGSPADFQALRSSLKACLPEYDSRNICGLLHNSITGRIANRLDISGPQYAVDAACSSGLVALQAAGDALRSRRADLALAGGIQGCLSPQFLMPFNRLGLLTTGTVPRPFCRDADGTLFGEGGGLVVLKRHEDALRDGNRVYALLRVVSVASDGRMRDLLDASEEGLSRALCAALEETDCDPSSLGMIEAHGSGILAQDRAELRALSAVFGTRRGACPLIALGSHKSAIGHCGAAAGIAGVIKSALSLHHRIIPPLPHPGRGSGMANLSRTPFYFNETPRPWVHDYHGAPRRAGVNTIGFGGIAGHAILEQFVDPA